MGLLLPLAGSSDLEFTAALHTYYKISDISKVRVEGLDGVTYSDSLQGGQKIKQEGDVTFDREVDRIYVQAPDTVKVMLGVLARLGGW